ncbi:MAG: nuclear transport factor 2 family protein [Rhodospirillaceae bacterium]|jgi:ketosteroid isomerase-like protein
MKYFVAATFICLSCLSHAGHHEKSETSENIMAMKAAYAAFSKGDIEAWKAEHSDDVVWTILEGLPYAGTHVGKDAIIQNVFSRISALWPDFNVEPISFFESGDRVFIHVKVTIGGKQTEALHMATMKDGKQVAFTPFENSAFMMQFLE